ncbi:MAG: hypothetical protein Fur0020_12410 [Thermodesulfovibrionia bacterium]
MKTNKTYLTIFIVLLVGLIITGLSLSLTLATDSDGWKKGTVSHVSKNSVKIDGRTYIISDSVLIKDVSGDTLPSDANYLRGVEEVIYKAEGGVLKEIRIFRRRH